MTLSSKFQWQADACERLGSPMYAHLLSQVAQDVDRGGVSAGVLAGHEDDPGPSGLALRMAGSVHRMVLEGRAPALAAYYPSVGGSWDEAAGWAAFEALLKEQPDVVREWLDRPPQTNEVGRAGALMGGLLHLERPDLPVRLFEIGSSGGLNLRVDHFGYTDERGGHYHGRASLVLERAWVGRELDLARRVRVAERVGSDVMPVDVGTSLGRLTLTSYVWPDQAARLERLRGAFEVAARVPAEVRRQDAAAFVDALEPTDGATTVLWHSVMWQYLSSVEQEALAARVEALGERATGNRRFAHLFLEPWRRTPDSPHEFLVVLREWPGGERRILGASVGHGIPTTWE